MAKGAPISANALRNLVREAERDVSKITEFLKEKALSGAKKVRVSRSSLNIYQINKLQQLGYEVELFDEEHYEIRGW